MTDEQTKYDDFIRGFAAATGLTVERADYQWSAYSRQLSSTERRACEREGHVAGLREGKGFREMFPDERG